METPPTTEPTSELDLSKPRWNGEPCLAQFGTALCVFDEESPPQAWWNTPENNLVGTTVPIIVVNYNGVQFPVYDDEDGRQKIFVEGGGPGSAHKSIDVAPDSWAPTTEVYGGANLLRKFKNRARRVAKPRGPRHTKAKRRKGGRN